MSAKPLAQLSSLKITDKELAIFSRQFAVCIGAGIPIIDSLKTILRSTANVNIKIVIFHIIKNLESGNRLSQALAHYPKIFSKLYRNLVHVGELSGTLDIMLQRNSTYIEKSNKIRSEVKGAMIYPSVILLATILIIFGLFYFVVPQIQSLFSGSKEQLPYLFNLLVSISEFIRSKWYYILFIVSTTAIIGKKFFETDSGKRLLDKLVLSLPVVRDLFIKAAMARFCRTFSVMLGSQVDFINSIESAAQSTNNYVIENIFEESKQSVINGQSIVQPLSRQKKYVPQMLVQMIYIGEQSGTLTEILNKVADYYEDEVELTARQMLTIIEPLLMVVLGSIIGFLLLALYLPIFSMAGIMGGG